MSESGTNFVPPKSIQINGYTYSLKDELKNNFYSYRCKYRSVNELQLKYIKMN